MATCHIINKLKSSDATIMKLVRIFALQCLNSNIWFQALHIPGRHNTGSDMLSRGRIELFKQMFPLMKQSSVMIPQHLLPDNLLIPCQH